ncbi:methyltransferase domain-containing protein [Actinoalloteichus spitiensis]|uniref:methyltransferase domain-containing protein n=1 Tax=Actinoalloteichus spitiensis TaxID=252394 RepID=UPI00036ABF83|nr:methyltransferase domain-containing protein [Actinoalloteichus spitiensis]
MTRTERLTAQLAEHGLLCSAWRSAFTSVRREWFVPPRIWTDDGSGRRRPVDREADPAAWYDAVYTNSPVLTQFDDGNTVWPDSTGRHCTSSTSRPDLLLRVLEALDVQEGDRVLEIGTGTGYGTALLAARLGSENVVSVEVDRVLAGVARVSLAEHGFSARVVCGDGAAGDPGSAPFDRVVSTAAVRLGGFPWTWVAQTRTGGTVVAPVRSEFAGAAALVRFDVTGDDRAVGRVLGVVDALPLRQHRPAVVSPSVLTGSTGGRLSRTALEPWRVAGTWEARWAVGVRVPGCGWRHAPPRDRGAPHTLLLVDAVTRSWARVRYDGRPGTSEVRQDGPRDLWNEVEAAYREWVALGRPGPDRYLVTVTPSEQSAAVRVVH